MDGWMGAESEQRLPAGYTLMRSIEAATNWQRTGPTRAMSSTEIDATLLKAWGSQDLVQRKKSSEN